MPEPRRGTFRQVRQLLRWMNYRRMRQDGSHERWYGPNGERVTVDGPDGRTVTHPLWGWMLDQMRLTEDEFWRLYELRGHSEQRR